jgi:hypothetical protein
MTSATPIAAPFSTILIVSFMKIWSKILTHW